MGRILNAAKALWSSAPPGSLMGSPAVNDAGGLLAGVLPYGVPPQRGSRELMIAAKRDPVLYAVTRKIADSFSAVPWRLYVARDAKGKPSAGAARAYRKAYAGVMGKQVGSIIEAKRRTKALADLRHDMNVEEILEHPFLDLLDRANPAMSGQTASQVTQVYTDLQGEALWIIERNAAGQPVEYWPIPPFWVYRTPFKGQPWFHVIFGTYQAHIPETDMVWMKIPDPENPYARGMGTGMSLADEIDTDEYAAKTIKAFFYNGAVPPYIVALEGASRDTLLQSKDNFEKDTRGFWNAMRAHWTNAKNLVVKEMSPRFVDMQLVELRKANRDAKIQAYGVPPEILGIVEHSNRSTIEGALFIFAEQVLKPRLEFRRSQYQTRLLPEYDDSLIVGFDNPTPDDREFTKGVMTSAPWAFRVDEFREMADVEPFGGSEGEERPPMPAAPAMTATPEAKPGTAAAPAKAIRVQARLIRGDKADSNDVDNVLEALRPDYLTNELDPVWEERMQSWADDALDATGANVDPGLLNPLIDDYLREFAGDRIEDLVNPTTEGELRAELIEGVKAGESIEDLSKRVEAVFDKAEGSRAERIARTEVLRASNFASTAAYKISGVVSSREWVATDDDRTRDAHLELDSQVVGIEEPFSVDGAAAMYPGDFGVPELDINCRCTTAPVIDLPDEGDDEEAAARAGHTKAIRKMTKEERSLFWKAFDRKLIPWEKSAQRALKRGFRAQRAAVLSKLRKVIVISR